MPKTAAITAKTLKLNLNGLTFTGLYQGSTALAFFINDTASTKIYTTHNTLSLHDALPICPPAAASGRSTRSPPTARRSCGPGYGRRSEEHTSELQSLCVISYAVFCLK